MAYDDNTGLIVPGAGFTKIAASGNGDLQRALGRNVMSHIQLIGDVNSNGVRVNKVNKFAKYKGFRYSGTFPDTAAGKAARLAANAAVNYGLDIPTYTGWSNLIANATTPWTYNAPNAYYRANDFDGYISHCREWGLDSSDAKTLYAPFGVALYFPNQTVGTGDYISFEVTKGNAVLDGYLLYLDDFNSVSLPLLNYYYGILAIASNSANSCLYVSEYKPSDITNDYLWFQVEVPATNDTYTFLPVLCSQKLTTPAWSNSIPNSGTVVTLDGYNLPGIVKQAVSTNLSVTVNYASQSASATTYTVQIRNRTGAAIDIGSIFMFVEPEYYLDWDPVVHAFIEEETDWINTTKTDSQFLQDVVYDNKVVAKYVDIYSVLMARGGANPQRIGSGSQYDVTLTVTMNAVEDGNNHPFNASSMIYGWFRYDANKHTF